MGVQMMNTYIIGIAYQQGLKGTNDGVHIMLVLLINKAMGVQMMGAYNVGTAYQQGHNGYR